ncbi:GspH/FimT family protein [Thermus altitudinis]|uniref:GspH/FimT family protein n=1 Tax=Thermus altitudinis TaxID=2908145 RepID=UPI001FAA8A0B|nr:GspH/FimT family protein [Thermus altitudinis]
MASRGLTLLELLVVLGMLGVLLGLGFPLLSPSRLAVDTAARSLAAQVTRARLEAIRQNTFAGLMVFAQEPGGYAVFLDRNGNRVYDQGEEVQVTRFGQGDWARVRLEINRSTLGNMPILFDPRGLPAKPITATLTLSAGTATRKVIVSQQGRARVE